MELIRLHRPVLTEKATTASEKHRTFTFVVDVQANKHQIRQAVEAAYSVTVRDVRTAVTHIKKALVTVAEGDTIDFYATE
jgi:large subunit ribosomal protein L23